MISKEERNAALTETGATATNIVVVVVLKPELI